MLRRRRAWLERDVFGSKSEASEVSEANAVDAKYRGAEGAAASMSIATADVGVSNPDRVEPTQYPQRTCVSLALCESRTSSHDLRATCANIGSREMTRNSGSHIRKWESRIAGDARTRERAFTSRCIDAITACKRCHASRARTTTGADRGAFAGVHRGCARPCTTIAQSHRRGFEARANRAARHSSEASEIE
jgi:hypothetical protein